ncbi:MAG: YjbH domain-containing protein, partial [Rhodovulum sp.]|nr:YjbH domain-containing protein [Rhodovulum sp.]
MFGGVSGEVLWKPVDSPLALGVEVNYAKQRDFDVLFGFQDYDVLTGHVSAYYEFGGGYLGRIDAGRYLAGDWGATFTLDREFANGLRVGAYFTLTDVSFEDFGEGSFDKGIRLSIPLSWLSGEPSQSGFGTSISPTTRDGGQRLSVRNRLYDVTRNLHDPLLAKRWGKFWR